VRSREIGEKCRVSAGCAAPPFVAVAPHGRELQLPLRTLDARQLREEALLQLRLIGASVGLSSPPFENRGCYETQI